MPSTDSTNIDRHTEHNLPETYFVQMKSKARRLYRFSSLRGGIHKRSSCCIVATGLPAPKWGKGSSTSDIYPTTAQRNHWLTAWHQLWENPEMASCLSRNHFSFTIEFSPNLREAWHHCWTLASGHTTSPVPPSLVGLQTSLGKLSDYGLLFWIHKPFYL